MHTVLKFNNQRDFNELKKHFEPWEGDAATFAPGGRGKNDVHAVTPALDRMRARNEAARNVGMKGCVGKDFDVTGQGKFKHKPCNNTVMVLYPSKQCPFCFVSETQE